MSNDLAKLIGFHIEALRTDWHNAIPPRRALQRFLRRPGSSDPNRNVRFLHGLLKSVALDVIVDSMVFHRPPTPETREHFESFIESGCTFFQIAAIAECSEVRQAGKSRANAENQSPIRQMIKRNHFTSELRDVPPRHRRDKWSETNALSPQSHCRQRNPRIHRRLAELKMIPDKKSIPARVFCFVCKLGEYACVAAEIEVGGVEREFH